MVYKEIKILVVRDISFFIIYFKMKQMLKFFKEFFIGVVVYLQLYFFFNIKMEEVIGDMKD